MPKVMVDRQNVRYKNKSDGKPIACIGGVFSRWPAIFLKRSAFASCPARS